MLKCPYCFEELREKAFALPPGSQALKCPYCSQLMIESLVRVDYPSVDKKKCIFCGKQINSEARICRYCNKWLDELDQAADNLE